MWWSGSESLEGEAGVLPSHKENQSIRWEGKMGVCGFLTFKNHILVVLMGGSLGWSPSQVQLLRNQQLEHRTLLERLFLFCSCFLRKGQ